MPVLHDEAIVLRCYDLAETDRIVVLFGQESGKFRGVAKGAKRLTSAFMGSLESATYVRVRFFEKEGSDLVKIQRCEIIEHYGKHPDFPRTLYLMYLTELLEEFSTDRNENKDLFRLVLATFRTLASGVRPDLVARYFEFWLLRLEGVWPNLRLCGICRRPIENRKGHFSKNAAAFSCARCTASNAVPLLAADFDAMSEFTRKRPSELDAAGFSTSSLAKLEEIHHYLIHRHLEREIRSFRILKELVPA